MVEAGLTCVSVRVEVLWRSRPRRRVPASCGVRGPRVVTEQPPGSRLAPPSPPPPWRQQGDVAGPPENYRPAANGRAGREEDGRTALQLPARVDEASPRRWLGVATAMMPPVHRSLCH
ncbi:unnamed protein product [Gadus morhua 'NCC']